MFEEWAKAQYVYPYTMKDKIYFQWAAAFQFILVRKQGERENDTKTIIGYYLKVKANLMSSYEYYDK